MTVLTSISALFFPAHETRVFESFENKYSHCAMPRHTDLSLVFSDLHLPCRLLWCSSDLTLVVTLSVFLAISVVLFMVSLKSEGKLRPDSDPLTAKYLEAMTQPNPLCGALVTTHAVSHIGKVLPPSWRPITTLSPSLQYTVTSPCSISSVNDYYTVVHITVSSVSLANQASFLTP